MKKILVIAMFAALAASSFAAELTLGGTVEYWGVLNNVSYENENGAGADDDSDTVAFNRFYADLVGKVAIVDGTNVNFRWLMYDADLDRSGNFGGQTRGNIDGAADRFWLDHMLTSDLKISLGRMGMAYNSGSFARGWFNIVNPGGESGTREGVRLDYTLSDTASLFFAADKKNESRAQGGVGTPGNRDDAVYVLGAKIKTGDLAINPSLSYAHGANDAATDMGTAFGAHINVALMPASGFQADITAALYKQQADIWSDGQGGYEKPMLMGFAADLGFAADFGKVGLFAAYASADDDAHQAFNFGEDWNRTTINDNTMWTKGNIGTIPLSGVTQIGLYADIKAGNSLTISPVFAYYMSNITDDAAWGAHGNVISEEATLMELDLNAKYVLTEQITLGAGFAYSMGSDLQGKNNDSGEDQMLGYWSMITKF